MLKNALGGISCLALLFAFTAPLLVMTSHVEADDNYQLRQPVIHYYVCDSGEIWGSTSYVRTTTLEVDHPPDDCRWHYLCWDVYNWETEEWEEECEWAYICAHVDHDMYYVYNSRPSIRYIDNHDAAACN